jgi:hypothetical protein
MRVASTNKMTSSQPFMDDLTDDSHSDIFFLLIMNSHLQDMVMLQMQVQGIVSMQVNSGPQEFASVFLDRTKSSHPPEKIETLQSCFGRMLHLVDEALHINNRLISDDQQE